MSNEIKPIEPPTGLPKGVKIAIAVIAIVIICLVAFTGCSTVQKLKQVEKSTFDSAGVTKIDSTRTASFDSTRIKKDNSVTTTVTEGDYTKETIIEFDTSTSTGTIKGTLPPRDIDAAADYFPPYTRPVKKITIKETGKHKTQKEEKANTYDSTGKKANEATQVNKDITTEVKKTTSTKNKVVKRTSYWAWLWLLPLLILLIVIYRYRKQIKFIIKKTLHV